MLVSFLLSLGSCSSVLPPPVPVPSASPPSESARHARGTSASETFHVRGSAAREQETSLVRGSSRSEEAAASPISYSDNCLGADCHASLTNSAWVHGPVSKGACGECHSPSPEDGAHSFRPARPDDTLCTYCHRDEKPKEFRHEPFAESGCTECHSPHGAKDRFLLQADTIRELCEKCHERPDERFLHGPFADKPCTICHEPHQSDHPRLLKATQTDLCLECHSEVAEAMAAAPHVHGPASVDCVACHHPHAGEDRLLLQIPSEDLCVGCHGAIQEKIAAAAFAHGAIESGAGCLECHAPHASNHTPLLRSAAGDLCLRCHDKKISNPITGTSVANIAKEISSAKYKHGPVRQGDCHGCHDPHASQNPDLLHESYTSEFYASFSEGRYVLCFRCHDQSMVQDERTTTLTRFRDKNRNLHYVHVNRDKGRTCRACHEVHASDAPSHIRRAVPFGPRGWMLPINYVKTASGGTCRPGCHALAKYDNSTAH